MQFVVVIFILTSCNQTKFNKNKWNEKSDPAFPPSYRVQMLNDLITNSKLVGMDYSQLIGFIGVPDNIDKNFIIYEISVVYNGDIDPIYTKKLVFEYSKDSLIKSLRIVEWQK